MFSFAFNQMFYSCFNTDLQSIPNLDSFYKKNLIKLFLKTQMYFKMKIYETNLLKNAFAFLI